MSVEISNRELKGLLQSIARQYPDELVPFQIADVDRIAFNISLVLSRAPKRLLDLGGGIGMFSIGCAALGIETYLVDDFHDQINAKVGLDALSLHRTFGVEIIESDIVNVRLQDLPDHLDGLTSFECLEHLHNSPKRTLSCAVQLLNREGIVVISGPNSVNLRKRLSVPFGIGKWSSMHDWYDSDQFRGHVREPDVADLVYIAESLGLRSIRIYGRNWMAASHRNSFVRRLGRAVDPILRRRPTLCSNIYVVGTNP